jgi:ribosomal protein S27AE
MTTKLVGWRPAFRECNRCGKGKLTTQLSGKGSQVRADPLWLSTIDPRSKERVYFCPTCSNVMAAWGNNMVRVNRLYNAPQER